MMTAIEQAKTEIEVLQKKLKACERELGTLQDQRPKVALLAERGDTSPLTKADAEIEKIRARLVTLQDAIRQAAWELKRAQEGELIPLLKATAAQWRKIRQGVSFLLTGLRQESDARAELQGKIQQLQISGFAPPTPAGAVLEAVTTALGVQVQGPRVGNDSSALEEGEQEFSRLLNLIDQRAKGPGPKRLPDPNVGRAIGALAAIANATRQ
jgi:hypothetical protein